MSEDSSMLSGRESGTFRLSCNWALALTAMLLMCVLAGCTPQSRGIETSLVRITRVYPDRHRPKPPPQLPVDPPRGSSPAGLADGLARIPGVRIVIDPGHGGKDTGAPAAFKGALVEKDIVLMIANRLAQVLRACGAEVIQTRTRDTFVELENRAAVSNNRRASLFVSIHADAFAKSSRFGTTLYIEPHAYGRTVAIAERIKASIEQEGIRCHGINDKYKFRVLVKNKRPAILIETGYMTNLADAKRLNSHRYRNKIAWVIARGITRYFSQ